MSLEDPVVIPVNVGDAVLDDVGPGSPIARVRRRLLIERIEALEEPHFIEVTGPRVSTGSDLFDERTTSDAGNRHDVKLCAPTTRLPPAVDRSPKS